MASSEEYRRHAGGSLNRPRDAKAKALLMGMADTWLRLAEQADIRDNSGSEAGRCSSRGFKRFRHFLVP
jgi:hypothetical protein